MPRAAITPLAPNTDPGQYVDLVHVIYPDDYFCVPDRILGLAHDALVNAALDDYVKANGVISEDADGDLIFSSLQQSNPRPTDLEEAKAILSDLGIMTFARV
jgi:hypothetical protein